MAATEFNPRTADDHFPDSTSSLDTNPDTSSADSTTEELFGIFAEVNANIESAPLSPEAQAYANEAERRTELVIKHYLGAGWETRNFQAAELATIIAACVVTVASVWLYKAPNENFVDNQGEGERWARWLNADVEKVRAVLIPLLTAGSMISNAGVNGKFVLHYMLALLRDTFARKLTKGLLTTKSTKAKAGFFIATVFSILPYFSLAALDEQGGFNADIISPNKVLCYITALSMVAYYYMHKESVEEYAYGYGKKLFDTVYWWTKKQCDESVRNGTHPEWLKHVRDLNARALKGKVIERLELLKSPTFLEYLFDTLQTDDEAFTADDLIAHFHNLAAYDEEHSDIDDDPALDEVELGEPSLQLTQTGTLLKMLSAYDAYLTSMDEEGGRHLAPPYLRGAIELPTDWFSRFNRWATPYLQWACAGLVTPTAAAATLALSYTGVTNLNGVETIIPWTGFVLAYHMQMFGYVKDPMWRNIMQSIFMTPITIGGSIGYFGQEGWNDINKLFQFMSISAPAWFWGLGIFGLLVVIYSIEKQLVFASFMSRLFGHSPSIAPTIGQHLGRLGHSVLIGLFMLLGVLSVGPTLSLGYNFLGIDTWVNFIGIVTIYATTLFNTIGAPALADAIMVIGAKLFGGDKTKFMLDARSRVEELIRIFRSYKPLALNALLLKVQECRSEDEFNLLLDDDSLTEILGDDATLRSLFADLFEDAQPKPSCIARCSGSRHSGGYGRMMNLADESSAGDYTADDADATTISRGGLCQWIATCFRSSPSTTASSTPLLGNEDSNNELYSNAASSSS